jgi:hypothetical protein
LKTESWIEYVLCRGETQIAFGGLWKFANWAGDVPKRDGKQDRDNDFRLVFGCRGYTWIVGGVS